jgi:hypothetical protein
MRLKDWLKTGAMLSYFELFSLILSKIYVFKIEGMDKRMDRIDF